MNRLQLLQALEGDQNKQEIVRMIDEGIILYNFQDNENTEKWYACCINLISDKQAFYHYFSSCLSQNYDKARNLLLSQAITDMNMPTANTNKSNTEEEKDSSSTTTEAITPDEKTPVEHDVDKNDNTSANELSFDSKKWIIALFVTLAAATLFGLLGVPDQMFMVMGALPLIAIIVPVIVIIMAFVIINKGKDLYKTFSELKTCVNITLIVSLFATLHFWSMFTCCLPTLADDCMRLDILSVGFILVLLAVVFTLCFSTMKLNSNILKDEKMLHSKRNLIVLANILLIIALYVLSRVGANYTGMDICFFAECYM